MSDSDDEYYDSDEEVSEDEYFEERIVDDEEEAEEQEESDYETDSERDNNFIEAEWNDSDDSDDSDEDEKQEEKENVAREVIVVKLKTSVTGDRIARTMDVIYRKNDLINIGKSKDTYFVIDSASNNIKAGESMRNSLMRGALHQYGTVLTGSFSVLTSKEVRKKGTRQKIRNRNYRARFDKTFAESHQFTVKAKIRGVMHNFEPRLKKKAPTRFNTEYDHLVPMVKRKNHKKVKMLVKYWKDKGKLTEKENHEYKHLIKNRKLLKNMKTLLHPIKETYSLLEGDKTPKIHKLIPVLSRLLLGDVHIKHGRETKIPPALDVKENDLSGIKIFKTEFKKRIKIKILDTLHLVHYEACL
eukprot:1114_1